LYSFTINDPQLGRTHAAFRSTNGVYKYDTAMASPGFGARRDTERRVGLRLGGWEFTSRQG